MIIHNWGEVEYLKAREMMQEIHSQAIKDKKNHLILCSHPNIFTIGADEKNKFCVETIKSDRGGSITCHSKGQNIFYFCFQVQQPAFFYKKVLTAFENFFMNYSSKIQYDKNNAGFYIENRKIASLGFRYSKSVSLHGVSLNVDVDLEFHSKVAPCNLDGIIPTSLKNEGIEITQEEVNKEIIKELKKVFNV